MSKREFMIHDMMQTNKRKEFEERSYSKKIIDVNFYPHFKQLKEEQKEVKSYDELAKQAVFDIKHNVRQIEKVKQEKEQTQDKEESMLKFQYIFYISAGIYFFGFIYAVINNNHKTKQEYANKRNESKKNDELRQMNYLYPDLTKKKN